MKAMLVMAENFKLMKVLVESLHVFVSITDQKACYTYSIDCVFSQPTCMFVKNKMSVDV